MKTPTVLLPLALCLLYSGQSFSQSSLYSQSNKEIEFNYGVISDDDLPLISEIEKIKYEFRYSERTHMMSIDANYQTTLDITIDSNGYEQPWMNLAKKFHHDVNGVSYYDKQGALMNTIEYTDEQKMVNTELANYARENGYHPGLAAFPVITAEKKLNLENHGYQVTYTPDSATTTLTYPSGEKETYNAQYLTITSEWLDQDGLKNIETAGYEPYQDYKGYIQTLRKHEKFLQSENGPCITEVKLVYYSDYQIQDHAGLINKATKQYRSITVYPNPNDGIFNVLITLPDNETITGTNITNIITGEITPVNPGNRLTFNVNIQNHLPGHYVIQVITTQTTLSTHFFKQ